VRCNFCNQSITHNLLNSSKTNGPNATPGNANVLTAAASTGTSASNTAAVVPKQYKVYICIFFSFLNKIFINYILVL